MMKPLPLLSVAGLSLGYRDTTIVRNVSFDLARGEILAVVGHNGAGKSTLIKTLLGALPAFSGELDWGSKKPQKIAYLGQKTDFDHKFPIRVRDLAAMGTWSDLGLFGWVDKAHQTRIDAALERTGTKAIADMPLHQLSAGQLQRTLFARTMVQDAELILLDEPFTAIDQNTEAALLELIDAWAAEGRAIILVLHDLSAVLQHCHSALLLGDGRALFGPPQETLTSHNLVSHGYLSQNQASWIEAMYTNNEDHHV